MTALHPAQLTADRRALLARRIRLFVTLTITWNVIEAAVALTAVSIFLLNIAIDVGYALLDARVRRKTGAMA